MLRNYIISAFRNLNRQFLFTIINLTGLAIALATVILIFLQAKHELSYDRFHANVDQIYRVEEDQIYNNDLYHVTVTPWPSGPVWQEEIPEIDMATRYISAGSILFRYEDNAFYESRVYGADSTFFRMFSFELLEGHPDRVLSEPNSIVISKETATKYFGDEDPMGKTMIINNDESYMVTGVFEDPPDNSSLNFDILISFEYMVNSPWYSEHWGSNSIYTYVMLNKKADTAQVNRKLTEIVDAHHENNTTQFMVAPLKKMHLYSYFGFNRNQMGIKTVMIFIAVGLFVLIIASINFMNLSTAKSSTRAREIAMRKINGAHKRNLMMQFLGESLIMVILSVLLAFILLIFLLEPFNQLTGKNFTFKDFSDPVIIAGIIILILVTGLFSGFYPALVLSSMKPLNILKSNFFKASGKGWFRKVTVIIQFSLGIILIIGTTVIYQQLTYMQNKELGYDKNNLLYISLRGDLKESYNSIKDELTRLPEVSYVSSTSHPPYMIGSNSSSIHWDGKDPEMDLLVSFGGVDFDYVEAMRIKMKSGRAFSEEYGSDHIRDTLGAFMINEELEKVMNLENIIGTEISFNGVTGPIVGVMENYHYQSARKMIDPLALLVAPTDYKSYMIIRLAEGDLSSHLSKLETAWNEIMPLYPFEYRFVDEDFDRMYRFEERMGKLMKALTIIAVIIAGIGLFGLSAFSAEQKTKEIGIRKAMGASKRIILGLFSREFVYLLLISALLSWPLAYYYLRSWLQDFDYRINLSAWIFIGAAILSLLIAMISISYQAVRAAGRNPADTLRYE